MQLFLNSLLIFLLIFASAQSIAADMPEVETKGDTETLRQAIDRSVAAVYPALVRIHVVSKEPQDGRMRKLESSGSGTIISEDGYVLTNHHVAGKADRLVLRMSNRREVPATLVGTDPLTDLAVLKIDPEAMEDGKKLPTAEFGDSDEVEVGDTVLAMGSPAGLSQSVTRGIVSNTEMISPRPGGFHLDGENVGELVRWIGHDAVIYPGNSGGPLVNLEGRIIGVNEVGIGSLGGAIPGNLARMIAQQLIEQGDIKRSWTGVMVQPRLKSEPHEKGILVSGVMEDSPAEAAGLQAGDIILEYAGEEVDSFAREDLPTFNRLVLESPVGGKVPLLVLRNDDEIEMTLTTVARDPAQGKDVEFRDWGLTARDLTRLSAMSMDRETTDGVQISSIRRGGPAYEAKPPLAPGSIVTHVNGQPILSIDDLERITGEITNDGEVAEEVLVTFERGEEQLMTVVDVGPQEPDDSPARPQKAWLGVETQVLTTELAEALGLARRKGVRVTKIYPRTTAEEAGLKVGDVFIKFDGTIINARRPEDAEVFPNMIRQYPVDAGVPIDLFRNGERMEVAVQLQPRPTPESELEQYENELFEFTARDMSFMDRVDAEMVGADRGVLIESVMSAGWAALAGLRRGDVMLTLEGMPVNSIEELRERMADLAERQPRYVVFFIKRGPTTGFIEFEPDWE